MPFLKPKNQKCHNGPLLVTLLKCNLTCQITLVHPLGAQNEMYRNNAFLVPKLSYTDRSGKGKTAPKLEKEFNNYRSYSSPIPGYLPNHTFQSRQLLTPKLCQMCIKNLQLLAQMVFYNDLICSSITRQVFRYVMQSIVIAQVLLNPLVDT